MTLKKGDSNYGSLKRSNFRGGIFKKYKFVLFDYLDEEFFSKWIIKRWEYIFCELFKWFIVNRLNDDKI